MTPAPGSQAHAAVLAHPIFMVIAQGSMQCAQTRCHAVKVETRCQGVKVTRCQEYRIRARLKNWQWCRRPG